MARYSRSKTVEALGYYKHTRGWVGTKQGRYTDQTPYYRNELTGKPSHGQALTPHNGRFEPSANEKRLVASRAYEKIISDLKDSEASLGNAIGEWRSSLDMVARRAIQLREGIQAARKGQISRAARLLSVPKDSVRKASKNVSKKHYMSSLWLETYFGWLPMIGDIYDSIDVLQDPIRSVTQIKGSSSLTGSVHYVQQQGGKPAGWNIHGGFHYRGRYTADVEITNHNLFLANRMGLLNPAAIAWELVPFSFVVDWFSNVGQIIESMTDLAGVTVKQSMFATRNRGGGQIQDYWPPGILNNFIQDFTVVEYNRAPASLAPQGLALRSPLGSWKRAGTQISLLTQLFIKPR